jgi:hypothetical protein
LTVLPGLYADRLNAGVAYSNLRQDVRANTLLSKNKFSFLSLFPIGRVVINPIFGFDLEMNSLQSELYPRETSGNSSAIVSDSMKNNLTKTQYKTYMGLDANYKIGKFKIYANLPVSYNWYQLKNKISETNNENLNKFYFEPSLMIQYGLSSKIDINGSASFYNGMNGIYELYNGYLLESYRYLNRYDGRFAGSTGDYQSLSISYKDIINMFFANATISANHYKSSVIYAQTFEDNLLLTSFQRMTNQRNSITTTGKISKGFDWIKLSTDLGASYLASASQQIRQDNLVDYKYDILSINGRLSAVPVSFLIVSYESAWQQSKSRIESQEAFTPIRSFTNTEVIDFKLSKQFQMGTQLEQYYNSSIQDNKYLYFSDLHFTYVWKQIHFELDWTNIMNTKNYAMIFQDNLNEYHSDYRIRPASLLLKMRFKLK